MRIDGQKATLVPIRGDSLVVGHQVAVSATILPTSAIGSLRSARGDRPVRAIPAQTGGSPIVAVSEALYDALDITAQNEWALTLVDIKDVKRATRVAIEAVDELNAAIGDVRRADRTPDDVRRHLGGAVLWRGADDASSLTLDLGGALYRVRALEPVAPDSFYTFDALTRVQRFASSARAGVDIVILADCSGSMATDDLDDSSSSVAPRSATAPTKRIEVVRRALDQLMHLRLATSGRTSKIALVSFSDEAKLIFPAPEGMADFDANAPPALIRQYQNAVNSLWPTEGTNIGRALIAAQDLLVKHGQPGNERLIVLLSDGADVPQSQQEAGEILKDFEDPVTVMDRLHTQASIRLHAIGISTPEIFRPWARNRRIAEDDRRFYPNHTLLRELMKVGGGDPARIGDTGMLREYFTDLGQGACHDLPSIAGWRTPLLSTTEQEQIAASLARARSGIRSDDPALQVLVYGLVGARQRCNERAEAVVGRRLFAHVDSEDGAEFVTDLYAAARTAEAFKEWLATLHQVFFDGRDGSTVIGTGTNYAVPDVHRALATEEFLDIGLFHCLYTATPGSVEYGRAWAAAQPRLRKRLGRSPSSDGGELPWYELQLLLLRDLLATLTRVEDAFARATVPSPAAVTTELDFVPCEKPLTREERNWFVDQILRLVEPELEVLITRLDAPAAYLPGRNAPLIERGLALLRFCEGRSEVALLRKELKRLVPN